MISSLFQVLVKAGDTVQMGDSLMVMNAMKMEVSLHHFRHWEDSTPNTTHSHTHIDFSNSVATHL